jgi:hypothetical protein
MPFIHFQEIPKLRLLTQIHPSLIIHRPRHPRSFPCHLLIHLIHPHLQFLRHRSVHSHSHFP